MSKKKEYRFFKYFLMPMLSICCLFSLSYQMKEKNQEDFDKWSSEVEGDLVAVENADFEGFDELDVHEEFSDTLDIDLEIVNTNLYFHKKKLKDFKEITESEYFLETNEILKNKFVERSRKELKPMEGYVAMNIDSQYYEYEFKYFKKDDIYLKVNKFKKISNNSMFINEAVIKRERLERDGFESEIFIDYNESGIKEVNEKETIFQYSNKTVGSFLMDEKIRKTEPFKNALFSSKGDNITNKIMYLLNISSFIFFCFSLLSLSHKRRNRAFENHLILKIPVNKSKEKRKNIDKMDDFLRNYKEDGIASKDSIKNKNVKEKLIHKIKND